MYLKNNKGVTLLALTITITVMMIITGTVIYNSNSHIRTEKVNKLYNDIENINTKIEDYYLKYGDIPIIGNVYCNKEKMQEILMHNANDYGATLMTSNDNIINTNDGDEYYIIDLEKLDGLILNYGCGDDYQKVKANTNEDLTIYDELYIINKITHQIYYPAGILLNNKMYYSYMNIADQISKAKVSYSKDDNNIILDNSEVITLNNFKIYGNSVQDGIPTLEEPVEIESVGDKTKNLFNVNEYFPNYANDEKGITYTNQDFSTIHSKKILEGQFKENTCYTFSLDYEITDSDNNGIIVDMIDSTDTRLEVYYASAITGDESSRITLTNNVNTTISYIRISYATSTRVCNIKLKNIQIEEGSTATEYESYGYKIPINVKNEAGNETTTNIYLDEPLRKIGDYADYIDIYNGTIVRNINISSINSINSRANLENVDMYKTVPFYNRVTINDIKKINDTTKTYVLSPSLKGIPRNQLKEDEEVITTQLSESTNVNAIYIRLNKNLIGGDTYENANAYLMNNPIEVHYILEMPIVEKIDLPNIITYEDKNIISFNTKIQPSDIDIEYYKISNE